MAMIKAILFAAATVASGHVRSDVRIPADVRQMPEAVSRLSQKAQDMLHSVTSQPTQFQEGAFLHLAEHLSQEGFDFGSLTKSPLVQGLVSKGLGMLGNLGRKPEQLQEGEQSDDEKKFNFGNLAGIAQKGLGMAQKFGLFGRQGADGSDQSAADQFTQGVEQMQPNEKVELLESLASHLQSVSDSVESISKMPVQAQQSVILGLLEKYAQNPHLDEKTKFNFMGTVGALAKNPLVQKGLGALGGFIGR